MPFPLFALSAPAARFAFCLSRHLPPFRPFLVMSAGPAENVSSLGLQLELKKGKRKPTGVPGTALVVWRARRPRVPNKSSVDWRLLHSVGLRVAAVPGSPPLDARSGLAKIAKGQVERNQTRSRDSKLQLPGEKMSSSSFVARLVVCRWTRRSPSFPPCPNSSPSRPGLG